MKYAVYFSLACLLTFGGKVNSNPLDVSYVFYSRDNFNGRILQHNADTATIRQVFNPLLPTVVLIHGWQDDFEADSNALVRTSILLKLNANIIKIDWGTLARQGYLSARNAAPSVGRYAAPVLSRISTEFNYPLSNVYLVGFSLGAHIAGIIGKQLPRQVGVIVALDPAGPLISSSDLSYSVHPSDAQYVQAIHTNAGTLGMTDPVGHADFYPNGGSRQPGCGVDIVGGCAHNRAWEFFAESVTGNSFLSNNCNDLAAARAGNNCRGGTSLMGGLTNINRNARGLFYLETNNRSPFGRG